jgi:hypothetical protein
VCETFAAPVHNAQAQDVGAEMVPDLVPDAVPGDCPDEDDRDDGSHGGVAPLAPTQP